MAAYVVTVPAVQVTVASRMFFLERGAAVPEGVDEAMLEHLVGGNFIAEIEADEELVEDLEDDGQGEPAGEPEDVVLDKLTKAQLVELAGAEGIDLAGAKTNAEMVVAIAAALDAKAPEDPAPAGSDSSNL